MKKTLRNIAILLLPILVYYGIFLVFEPNNYFGLKPAATGTDIMATLRQYQRQPQNHIILGDSRLAKLDESLVEDITGNTYQNLAFGGASLAEQLDVLDWVMEQNPDLEQVVFGLSFYTLNKGYSHNRNIIMALQNPLVYLTNLGYNINMLTNIYDHLSPNRMVGDADETMDPAAYEYVPYVYEENGAEYILRKTIAEHLAGLALKTHNWQLDEEEFARLLETIQLCEEKGIRFVLVLPPAHSDVLVHIVQRYGIDEVMPGVLARLAESGAVVIDYEFGHRDALRDDQFYDGFHLDTQRGLTAFCEMLFCEIEETEIGA